VREDVPLAIPQLTPQSGRIVAEPRWDLYYAVVFTACLAIVQAAPVPASQRIIATAALAAMVPWYLFLGRPLMRQDQPAARPGTAYLAGLAVLFAVAQSQDASTWFLAFALLPQCFHVTSARRGLVFVVIFNVIGGAFQVWRDPRLGGALSALGIVAFAVAFAYVYSRWMARVIEQSLDRAALIEQLEATRAELAAAHHEAGVRAERHRLAGEIHDTLAQGFTSIVTLLQAAEASLDAESQARRHRYRAGAASPSRGEPVTAASTAPVSARSAAGKLPVATATARAPVASAASTSSGVSPTRTVASPGKSRP